MTTTTDTETRDIHGMFGLTYSNYLVLPRTLLQSMPEQWQHDFVTLVEQMHEAFAHVDQAESYIVTAANECTYSDLTEEDMKALGVTYTLGADGLADTYFHNGEERRSDDRVYVPRPSGDPVPHYNRGRTRIEPQLS